MNTSDRDLMIRFALTPPVEVQAPDDLGDSIYREVLATRQRRGLIRLGRLVWLPAPSALLVTLALLALLAIGLVIVALSRPASPPIIAMYHGGPDRTGVMPGPGPAGEPVIQWDVGRPGAIPFNSMPIPLDGRLLVGDNSGVLAALDVDSGSTLWELDVGSPIRASPAIAGDLVMAGTDEGAVVAARAADGGVAWRRDLADGLVLGSLLAADDTLYAGTQGGTVFAVDPATGAVRWSLPAGGAVTRGPVFGDGVLYVGAMGGRVSAIDVETRTVRWAVELGPGEVGTPTLGDGFVYASRGLLAENVAHDLVAIDIDDGSTVWSYASPAGGQVHMGALSGNRLYAISEDGTLTALEPATGEVVWRIEVVERLATPVAIVGDIVYLSAEPRSVVALDAHTGRERWRVPVVGNASAPAVVDGRVFVGTSLGRVVAIGGSEESPAAP
jgi:eukaryotic-like serine/threonine-protein kinase